MSAGVAERAVAKKSADTSVRIDVETADVVRRAAALKGMSIVEYIRSVLLPVAKRDLTAEARKIVKNDKPEP